MWFVGFSQGQKAGELIGFDKGQKAGLEEGKIAGLEEGREQSSSAIITEIKDTGYLRVPAVDAEGKSAVAVLQLIKDEKGQIILYKPE